jgi:hypothetical protein
MLCVMCVRRRKGKRTGKRKQEREGKKEGNRNLENFPDRKFMRISKIKYKELVQKLILYKRKK